MAMPIARLARQAVPPGVRRSVAATEKVIRRGALAAKSLAGLSQCRLCGAKPRLRFAYGRPFNHCPRCNFIFTEDLRRWASKGMGMEGSWSGAGGGGYRELWLAEFMHDTFGKQSILLFGTGNTPTFEAMRRRGWDVTGCDIDEGLVRARQKEFGADAFVHSGRLPPRAFDVVVAVEVFEHLDAPMETLRSLAGLLTDRGVVCGTTNFYLGGAIEDANTPGYMSHELHVAYWSPEAMAYAGNSLGLKTTEFQMERPGSVYPDEKYGQLWPNKRVFFLCKTDEDHRALLEKRAEYPILPIDQP